MYIYIYNFNHFLLSKKYLSLNTPIYIIGIEFDVEKRNIVKLEWEEVEKL